MCKDDRATNSHFVLPQLLDIGELYNPDANEFMWAVSTVPPTAASAVEPYLTNDDVQRGITAMHMRDRAQEELHRLIQELKTLGQWIASEMYQVNLAIYHCTGM